MGDNRLKILIDARRILEEQGASPTDRDALIRLLDILTAALERQPADDSDSLRGLSDQLISNHALLFLLKQQTDELDALKKLSINLTSQPRSARCAGCGRDRSHAPDRQRPRRQHFPL